MAKKSREDPQTLALIEVAETTLAALDRGSFMLENVGEIYLTEAITRCVESTRFYPPDSVLSGWKSGPSSRHLPQISSGLELQVPDRESIRSKEKEKECKTIILSTSTLAGARLLASTTARDRSGKPNPNIIELEREDNKIGVLNFASAKTPGGGFQSGAQAQEESLTRSSSLYPSITSPAADPFYTIHLHDPRAGYYSHSMIYSPNVLLMRDDDGAWQKPVCVDVLTSAAVNARVVSQSIMGRLTPKSEQAKVERVMRERAARALYSFERHGVRHLVLGAWGCGVFGNDVKTIAHIWADLLGRSDGRFRRSFDRVLFAVMDAEMCKTFETAFESRVIGDGRYSESASIHSETSA